MARPDLAIDCLQASPAAALKVPDHLRPEQFALANNHRIRMLGGLRGQDGGVQAADHYRDVVAAVGVGDLVGVECPGGVGGQGDQVKVEARLRAGAGI